MTTKLDDLPKPPVQVPSRAQVLSILTQLGPLIGLVLVGVLFSSLRFSRFATLENLRIMLAQTAVVGTAAIGMTLIIISGGIDLSVGSNIALTGMFVVVLLKMHCPPIVAAAGGALAGSLCGLLIGTLVVGREGE